MFHQDKTGPRPAAAARQARLKRGSNMLILQITAVALMAAGAITAYWQYTMLQNKEITIGRVVDLPKDRGSKGGTVYGIDAAFNDRAGNEHRYISSWKASDPGYKQGDAIRIYFSRLNPNDCGLCSFGVRFGAAWVVFLAGAVLFIGAWGARRGNEFMEKAFPVTVHAGAASLPSDR